MQSASHLGQARKRERENAFLAGGRGGGETSLTAKYEALVDPMELPDVRRAHGEGRGVLAACEDALYAVGQDTGPKAACDGK